MVDGSDRIPGESEPLDMGAYLRLAVPSDGALHETTLTFLRDCGIGVLRQNQRRYIADIPALPGVSVLFQRSADITPKIEEGSADLGVLGLDRFLEMRRDVGAANVVIDELGFGRCELVVGVPDSWIDVTSIADLADLSMEFRERGTDLRVATKSPRLIERFLLTNGVNYFSLVHSSGTLEAAPAMGFADIIADVVETGVTMRENRLKTIRGGTVMTSEACLVGNSAVIGKDERRLALATSIVELIEAHLQSRDMYSITANIRGEAPEEVASCVLEYSDISGLRGPTISKVYTDDGQSWYAVTIIVEREKLLTVVNRLRQIGGTSVTVSQPSYVFHAERSAVARLT